MVSRSFIHSNHLLHSFSETRPREGLAPAIGSTEIGRMNETQATIIGDVKEVPRVQGNAMEALGLSVRS